MQLNTKQVENVLILLTAIFFLSISKNIIMMVKISNRNEKIFISQNENRPIRVVNKYGCDIPFMFNKKKKNNLLQTAFEKWR